MPIEKLTKKEHEDLRELVENYCKAVGIKESVEEWFFQGDDSMKGMIVNGEFVQDEAHITDEVNDRINRVANYTLEMYPDLSRERALGRLLIYYRCVKLDFIE